MNRNVGRWRVAALGAVWGLFACTSTGDSVASILADPTAVALMGVDVNSVVIRRSNFIERDRYAFAAQKLSDGACRVDGQHRGRPYGRHPVAIETLVDADRCIFVRVVGAYKGGVATHGMAADLRKRREGRRQP